MVYRYPLSFYFNQLRPMFENIHRSEMKKKFANFSYLHILFVFMLMKTYEFAIVKFA